MIESESSDVSFLLIVYLFDENRHNLLWFPLSHLPFQQQEISTRWVPDPLWKRMPFMGVGRKVKYWWENLETWKKAKENGGTMEGREVSCCPSDDHMKVNENLGANENLNGIIRK